MSELMNLKLEAQIYKQLIPSREAAVQILRDYSWMRTQDFASLYRNLGGCTAVEAASLYLEGEILTWLTLRERYVAGGAR